MSEKTPKKEDGSLEAAKTSVAVGTALIAAVASPAVVAVSGIVGAGVPSILDKASSLIANATARTIEARFRAWMEDVAAALNYGSSADLERELDKNLATDWARDSVTEAFRGLVNALDDAAVRVLAAVSADHIGTKTGPTGFHRALATMVASMDRREIRDLTSIVAELVHNESFWTDCRALELTLTKRGTDREFTEVGTEDIIEVHHAAGSAQYLELDLRGSELRLWNLLKTHALGFDNPTGYMDTRGGPQVVVMPCEIVRSLNRLLPREPQPNP